MSCPEGIDLIQAARDRGVRVTAETCPHYLLLTDESVGEIGASAKCAPPLRDAARREEMWKRIRAGMIETLGSDHSPAPPEMKISEDFFCGLGWNLRLPACVPFGFGGMVRSLGIGWTSTILRNDRDQRRGTFRDRPA